MMKTTLTNVFHQQVCFALWMIVFGLIMYWAICDNTSAIREQTEILSRFNLIQAPERIEEIVIFEQEEKPDETERGE